MTLKIHPAYCWDIPWTSLMWTSNYHSKGWINPFIGQETASLKVDVGICMISICFSHSQKGVKPLQHNQQHHMGRRKKCCPLSAVLISAHTGAEIHIHTHTHILRGKHKHACGASTCLWLGSPLHVFLFRVKQKKHNDQTVLQVVLEAQLCADCTVDVLFCLGVGGGGFPAFRCIHMEKDGNGGSKWVYE